MRLRGRRPSPDMGSATPSPQTLQLPEVGEIKVLFISRLPAQLVEL